MAHKLLGLIASALLIPASAEMVYSETKGQENGILIITSKKLEESWAKFAEWKTATGKPTKIITVSEIEERFKGVDTQDRIRKCVLESASDGEIKWVIIGGDSSPVRPLVPDRDTKHNVYGQLGYADIPTDSYYLSDKSWDANEDGIYGEWEKDREEVSYINENLTIGRIPIRVTEDVEAFTEKIIAYESQYPTDGFAENLTYTCTVKQSCPKLLTSWEAVKKGWSGKGQHYFSHKTPWDNEKAGDFDLSVSNLLSKINEKSYSKFHIHGHGFMPVWMLEGEEVFTAGSVRGMKNDNAYLCMTTVSCFTGQFDSDLDPSITESMLRQPNAGAVIVVAPAREGVPIFHDPQNDMKKMVLEGKMDGTTTFMTSFWKHGLSKAITAGEAFHLAKKDMIADAEKSSGYHWVLSEINLLGDPTIDLRPTSPKNPTFKAEYTENKLEIETNAGEGAMITVWQKGKFFTTRQVSKEKAITIEVSEEFDEKAFYVVSVSGHGLNSQLKVVNGENPF